VRRPECVIVVVAKQALLLEPPAQALRSHRSLPQGEVALRPLHELCDSQLGYVFGRLAKLFQKPPEALDLLDFGWNGL
jgi:hypothetical protein